MPGRWIRGPAARWQSKILAGAFASDPAAPDGIRSGVPMPVVATTGMTPEPYSRTTILPVRVGPPSTRSATK